MIKCIKIIYFIITTRYKNFRKKKKSHTGKNQNHYLMPVKKKDVL